LPIIRKVVSKKFDLKEHIEQLKREVSPLLKFSEFGDGKVYSFISKCVDLFEAVKQNNAERKEEIEEFVKERVENVWRKGLNVILAKENELRKVMSDNFWEELGFDDIDFLIREIAPLIAYYEKDRKNMLVIDADDFVINVEEEIKKVDKNPDFEKFKEGSLIKKFKEHGLTWKELLELEKQLSELNPSFTIEKIQKARKIDFVLFLREMIGLSTLPDPQIMIENEFNQFIVSRNKSFNVAQIEFLRYLSKFFAQSKHLELKDFAEHPLAEENPMELFSTNQLKEIVRQAETIKFK
jgi:type I restriction enzyme R subunit